MQEKREKIFKKVFPDILSRYEQSGNINQNGVYFVSKTFYIFR